MSRPRRSPIGVWTPTLLLALVTWTAGADVELLVNSKGNGPNEFPDFEVLCGDVEFGVPLAKLFGLDVDNNYAPLPLIDRFPNDFRGTLAEGEFLAEPNEVKRIRGMLMSFREFNNADPNADKQEIVCIRFRLPLRGPGGVPLGGVGQRWIKFQNGGNAAAAIGPNGPNNPNDPNAKGRSAAWLKPQRVPFGLGNWAGFVSRVRLDPNGDPNTVEADLRQLAKDRIRAVKKGATPRQLMVYDKLVDNSNFMDPKENWIVELTNDDPNVTAIDVEVVFLVEESQFISVAELFNNFSVAITNNPAIAVADPENQRPGEILLDAGSVDVASGDSIVIGAGDVDVPPTSTEPPMLKSTVAEGAVVIEFSTAAPLLDGEAGTHAVQLQPTAADPPGAYHLIDYEQAVGFVGADIAQNLATSVNSTPHDGAYKYAASVVGDTVTITRIDGLPIAAAQILHTNESTVLTDSVLVHPVDYDPHDGSDQGAAYVVDLAPFATGWGRTFLAGPAAKSSRPSDTSFWGGLISAQAISRLQATGAPAPAPAYSGAAPPVSTNQFAYSFNEFSNNYNGNVSGFINYAPNEPSRLYVTRTVAATNGCDPNENGAQLGGCAIDELGNLVLRVDGFGATGGCEGLAADDNIYLFNVGDRTDGALNVIGSGSGDIGAFSGDADWIVRAAATTHSAPQVIPASQTGGTAIYAGPDFAGQYRYGSAFGAISSTTDHRFGSTDQRGTIAYLSQSTPSSRGGGGAGVAPPLVGSAGTAGMLVKDGLGLTNQIAIWGLDPNGGVFSSALATIPPGIIDNCDGYSTSSIYEATNYQSQAAFRGGVAQVALGRNLSGLLVVAATINDGVDSSVADWGANAIAAGFVDPNTGVETLPWTLAGWIDPNTGLGKEFLDGPSGAPAGRLLALGFLTGGTPAGPSLSSPGIDATGNVYFTASFQQYVDGIDDPLSPVDDRFSVGLFRANYDPLLHCFELELLLAVGDTLPDLTAGRDYVISFMGIADSDSISSGAFFSNNVSESAANNIDPSMLADGTAPESLGGLGLNVELTYDYVPCPPLDPNEASYNSMLFVTGAQIPTPDDCPEDLDGSGDVNSTDLSILLSNFGTTSGATKAEGDVDGDGDVDSTDLSQLLGVFGAACPTI